MTHPIAQQFAHPAHIQDNVYAQVFDYVDLEAQRLTDAGADDQTVRIGIINGLQRMRSDIDIFIHGLKYPIEENANG